MKTLRIKDGMIQVAKKAINFEVSLAEGRSSHNGLKRIRVEHFQVENIKYFYENAHTGLTGEFNNKLFAFSIALAERGYSEEVIKNEASGVARDPLDSNDLKTINSGYKTGIQKYQNADLITNDGISSFTESFLEKNDVHFNLGGTVSRSGKLGNLDSIATEIHALAIKYKVQGRAMGDIRSILGYIQVTEIQLKLEELREGLKFVPNLDSSEMDKAVRAIIGTNCELTKAVLAHFIWQVKRKLNNLGVEHHMMPILYGKTGSGKTRFIEKLLQPVAGVITNGDFSMLADSREKFRLHENYVIFFDEMARADRTNVESIKNSITSSMITYRTLSTNSEVKIVNNASFIGASNKLVSTMINDPTSARRFYQIDTLDKLDWSLVNSVNYPELWQSVDERSDSPIIPYMELVKEKQEEFKADDPLGLFCKDYGIAPVQGDNYDLVAFKSIYATYKRWCEENGYKSLASAKFGKNLKAFLGKDSNVRHGKGIHYKLPKEHLIKEFFI